MRDLSPPDETRVRASSMLPLIDLDMVDDPAFVYGQSEIEETLTSIFSQPVNLSTWEQQWLLDRGVIRRQLEDFRSFSAVTDLRQRIVSGIEIHPALQRWIGFSTPTGVLYPARNPSGKILGCHGRLFNTVPKIKFSSACPLVYVSSNLHRKLGQKTLWFVEGVFDGLALDRYDQQFVAPSSGYWMAEQLITAVAWALECGIETIICAHDRDRVGTKENLVLGSSLGRWFNIEFVSYPDDSKDMSEYVCKNGRDPQTLPRTDLKSTVSYYLSLPYQKVVDFDAYLDHRNTAYSTENYRWSANT